MKKNYLITEFNKFVNEKLVYLSISDQETSDTIASFDTEDPKDVKRLNQVKSTLSKSEIYTFLHDLLVNVNSEYPKIMADQLLSLFSNNLKFAKSDNAVQELKKMLVDSTNIYNFKLKTGLYGSINDIYNHYSDYFDKDFFMALANKQLGVRPMTGPIEGLLALFTDLKFLGKIAKGDLMSPSGSKIEVKGRNGRVGGTTSHYIFIKELTANLLELFEHYDSKVSLNEYKSDFKNIFKKSSGGFSNKMAKELTGVCKLFYDNLSQKDKISFIHSLGYVLKGYRDKKLTFNEKINTEFFKILTKIVSEEDYSSLIDYKALIDFYGYKEVDHFEYLLFSIYPKISKNEIDLNNSFLIIDIKRDSVENVFKIFRKYLHVTGAAEWHSNGTGVTATTNKQSTYKL